MTHTDEEWRKLLSPAAYNVLRRQGTKAPGSSPLDAEERPGAHCAGSTCRSTRRRPSTTAGPAGRSFSAPLDNAVATSVDKSWFATRTEVHCRRCGGHLGHVFDAPATGKRYCMDGVALRFAPGEELS